MNNEQKFGLNNRRDFLKIVSKAGLSIPLLKASALGAGILASRQAMAAPGDIKRVVFIYVPQGTPSGASNTYTPSANLALKACSLPLEAVKSECIFFSGTSVVKGNGISGDHGLTHRVLGGFNAQKTIDLALEGTIGASSPIGSMHVGVMTAGADPVSSINQNGINVYIDNPNTVFNTSFGGGLDVSGDGVKRKRAVLDINRDALAKIKTKLGAFEKQRLEENESAVEKLQRDLEASVTVPAGCTNPAFNTSNFTGPFDGDNFSRSFDLQIDNIVLAFKCNLTKVASIQLGTHQGDFSVTGIPGNYHGSVHGGSEQAYINHRAYMSGRVASMIQKLKTATDENGQSLLNSTLILQVTDMGNGSAHSGTDAPFMMAGGGSAISRGKVMSVGKHTQLLDTVAYAMGAGSAIPKYSSEGPVSGILT